MALFKFSALGTFTTLIDGVTASPTLKGLANNARVIGNAIDLTGSSDRLIYANFDLLCRFTASTPVLGAPVELYLIPAIDGTNYVTGDATDQAPPACLVGVFGVVNKTAGQRLSLVNVLLPNAKWKPLIWNKTGVAMTSTDSENILSYRTFVHESV